MTQVPYDKVQQLVDSGQTASAACRTLGINPQSFYNWKNNKTRKARRKDPTKPKRRSRKKPSYQAIPVAASQPSYRDKLIELATELLSIAKEIK